MNFQNDIVHEAEVQRQFVRLRIPVEVVVNGQRITAFDWSAGGFSLIVARAEDTIKAGRRIELTLNLRFSGFDLSLPLKAEAKYTAPAADEGGWRIGFAFVEVGEEQASALRYVVGSYLSGELSHAVDVFASVHRDNSAKSRTKSPPPMDKGLTAAKAGRFLTGLAALCIGFLVIGFVGLTVYEKVFLTQSSIASVTMDGDPVKAPQSGVLTIVAGGSGAEVAIGAPLISIESATGVVTFMDSPCDCIVVETLARDGVYVSAGQDILTLVEDGGGPIVRALFAPEEVDHLIGDETATFRIVGSNVTVEGVVIAHRMEPSSQRVAIDIAPMTELPASAMGAPAVVTLSTLPAAMKLEAVSEMVRGAITGDVDGS